MKQQFILPGFAVTPYYIDITYIITYNLLRGRID